MVSRLGPATGIEVFKSAGTLVFGVQLPSQQQGYEKSWVRISRGIEEYARQCVPTEDWPPTSCGRAITAVTDLRATASTGNQWQFDSQIQSCAKVKAHINWFQSTSLDIDSSNSVNEKRLWILRTRLQAPRKESTSWRLSWSWRIIVLTNMTSAEQTQYWDKEKWTAALGSVCWQTQNGVLWWSLRERFFLHSCSARTQSWCQNQSNFFPLTKMTEHIFHTGRDFQI